MIARSLVLIFLFLPINTIAVETTTESSAALLGLVSPLKIELNIWWTDGGTLGGTIIDSEETKLKFSYDGRQTFSVWLPWHKYHVYVHAHHPTHEGAVKLPICSDEEIAIYTLVANWVDREYPSDWRDTKKWASTGYIVRYIDDMESRKCKKSK